MACKSPGASSPIRRRKPATIWRPFPTSRPKSGRRRARPSVYRPFKSTSARDPSRTAGDEPDVLVAFNPAALKVNLNEIHPGGLIILDSGTFSARNLDKAGFENNPLEDDTLEKHRSLKIDISKLTLESVKQFGLTSKEGLRCKNFWTLGLVYWLYGRDRTPTTEWLKQKFASRPEIADANIAALNAGHAFAETAEMPGEISSYIVPPAELEPGVYRNVTGTDALAWGLLAGSQLAELKLMFCSYPITPASSLLHTLARLKHYDVVTFQAEDEIAAVCSAIGASYTGAIGGHVEFRPGRRPERRGDRVGHLDRAAADRRQLAARRAIDRPADEDRAVGPVSIRVWPQRGQPARRTRIAFAIRLFRGGNRGGAPCHEIHDAGDRADRRLYRERGRALEDSRHGGLPAVPGGIPHRDRRIPSLPARSGDAGAAVGQTRHAGPGTPHWRHRESLRQRAHLPTTPKTIRK